MRSAIHAAPHGFLRRLGLSRRARTLLILALSTLLLAGVCVAGITMHEDAYAPNFQAKNRPPDLEHPLGTDWMGRDMLARTIKGLTISIGIGLPACAVSAVIALGLALLAVIGGKTADAVITWLIDLVMGLPHLILLILISFMLGKGAKGVVFAVILTHWTSLARVLRSETLEKRQAPYVQIARHLGKSPGWIARHHILPHLLPQVFVGTILLFPHAILHEASITFLGFGLPPETPAIGVILSESMKYLSTGQWWLAFFPGLALLIVVMLFDAIGENCRMLLDPRSAQD